MKSRKEPFPVPRTSCRSIQRTTSSKRCDGKDAESRLPFWVRFLLEQEARVKAEAATGKGEGGNVSF